ncbi:MAG: CBS domain-containing protein [Desulfobacterales bacterium]|nr:CBS domain-containing protein [Desulfobacterales bacterium]MBF0397482.1 CBS domain-containing protein [Desulfobacterales bacterium]
MKIKSLMVSNPITITEKASVSDAVEVMKKNRIRHLPVVSNGNILKGFVTLADLKVGLIPALMQDISLSDLIVKNPLTVEPEDDIEKVAQIIYKHKISGMPVVKNGKLVGIITETDILRTFIEMMGFLEATSRIDVVIGDKAGSFKKALQIIYDINVGVVSVGIMAQDSKKKIYYFRLTPCDIMSVKNALEKGGFEVVSVME